MDEWSGCRVADGHADPLSLGRHVTPDIYGLPFC